MSIIRYHQDLFQLSIMWHNISNIIPVMPTASRVLNELPLNSTVKGVAPLFIQTGNLEINIVLGIVSQQLI